MRITTLQKMVSFCKAIRTTELRNVALLGCPMKVRKSRHFFQLEVNVGGHIDNQLPPETRISCKVIFMCPKCYPHDLPEIHIRSKRNFPDHLESAIFVECERIRHLYRGSQHIMAMVSSALYMIEREERKFIQKSNRGIATKF